jgi:hypothetical protein
VAWSGWGQDPFSRGGYSFARPSHAEDRRALSESLAGRLFFAGEACSRRWHSTVHGAWVTGQMPPRPPAPAPPPHEPLYPPGGEGPVVLFKDRASGVTAGIIASGAGCAT